MASSQKFCLKWDGFQSSVTSLFDHLRQDGELVDITLCCEGQQIKAHRMMLSACSPYFRDLLKNNPCQQMVFFLKDTSASDLRAIVEFMYKGSVNVAQSQLASFIKTAEMLQIRGLSGDEEKRPLSPAGQRAAPPAAPTPPPPPLPPPPASPPSKRRRPSGPEPAALAVAPPPPLPPPPPPPPRTPPEPRAAPSPLRCAPSSPAADGPPAPASQSAPTAPTPPPPPPPPPLDQVKVEKVDLSEDDVDSSLDATLCHVAEYEGGYDGSDHSLDLPLLTADLSSIPPLPGPSQRTLEDGSVADAGRSACYVCGKTYRHKESLQSHIKKHQGLTTCAMCGKVCGTVKDLRRHLEHVHCLSWEQVRQIVPTKPRDSYHFAAGF